MEQNLLTGFIRDIRQLGFDHIQIWGQIVIVILALLIGYGVGRYAKKRFKARTYPTPKKSARARGFVRLVFPGVALLIISVAHAILEHQYQYHNLRLLDLIGALLLAMILLRLVVRMLQVTFPSKPWVRQSERGIVWAVWTLFALYAAGFSTPIIAFLETISFPYGRTTISLWGVIHTVVLVAATLLVALTLSYFIETRLLSSTSGDASLRVVLARLVKAVFITLAFMIALPLAGVDLTVLSVFGGALGVGLGFGLQKIASNYISGFILLMDRSVRIGDLINAGGSEGKVQGLTARYIILKAADGAAALIPNDTIISNVVVNRSFFTTAINPHFRIAIPVQVSYDSDIKLAMQLMLDATKGIPRILADPAPAVLLQEFADNGINLELGFWIADPEKGSGDLKTEVNTRLWESFNNNNISFPYPHRDISLVSIPESLEQRLQNKNSNI